MKQLLVVCLLACSFIAIAQETVIPHASAPASKVGYKIGDVIEDFVLKNVDERMITLDEFQNARGYIIAFTCNHCPYAKMYEQRLIDLHNMYAPQGYPVIAINPNDPEVVPDDSFEDMQALAKEKKYPFVYLIDEGQQVYPKFGAARTPHIYLLDNARAVRYIGAIDDSAKDATKVTKKYLEDAIKALQAGKSPDPAFTKAIGCTIKVKS
jgi:peroxiredoxin